MLAKIGIEHFAYKHIPNEELQAFSKNFHDLAEKLIAEVPDGRSKEISLEKLLEAKDAAVRARAVG